METTLILLNAYYIFLTLALMAKEILWLRVIMILAGISIINYGLILGNDTIVIWNAVFLAINIVQVIRIMNERKPINLPDDIKDIYENIFTDVTKKEFFYFWNTGKTVDFMNERICTSGKVQKELYLIIDGSVKVKRNENEIAVLTRGSFVAEMSFLTGEPASADVFTEGKSTLIAWSQEKLKNLKILNPNLYIRLQNILSKDLTKKLKTDIKKPAV